MTESILFRSVEIEERITDLRVEEGVIVAIGDDLPAAGAKIIDGDGGALIPGLHDHHVHLLAMAARKSGVDLDAMRDPESVDHALGAAATSVIGDQWLRVTGYDEHHHGELSGARVDAFAPRTKIRIQHRSGLAWFLSGAGLDDVDAETSGSTLFERDANGSLTGWLHRGDAWLAERVPQVAPSIAPVSRELASLGITGITDATVEPGRGRLEILRSAVSSGDLVQKLTILGAESATELDGWAHLGPYKLLVDDVLGLDPDGLAQRITSVHASGRAVAIHAVTRSETVTAVTALMLAGVREGDRIEHGSVLPADLDRALASSGVVVIVQPSLVSERGDHYFDQVEPDDMAFLHRHASLLAAGIRVAAGSDAPVTSADPWAAIAAASTRRTREGRLLGESEKVPAAIALNWFLGDPQAPAGPVRRLIVGAAADLCLLDRPLGVALLAPDRSVVRMTFVAGRLAYS
jgi:predicted amidohydrolase YtcJ